MDIPEPIQRELELLGGIKGLKKSLPHNKKIVNLKNIIHAISDQYRLKILLILNKQPVCVCIIKDIIGISDSKLSYHLSTLRDNGLIYGKQQGNWIIYYLTKKGNIITKFINENLAI